MRLFIIRSDSKDADIKKTIDSFKDIIDSYKNLNNLDSINREPGITDWFFIIYDNECIDNDFLDAFRLYLSSDYDVITCMKKDKIGDKIHVTESPRCFRAHVKLMNGSMQPVDDGTLKITRLLDGWILSHACNKSAN